MHALFAPASVVTLFVAGVLFFLVAERLSLASRKAALAVKLAAGALTLSVVMDLPFLQWRLSPEVLYLVNALLLGGSWGCLAWAVLAVLADAAKEGAR